ncbi:uncharacterized protein LOC141623751 isoform X2 [Silene latifolia]|uniref:uncharacterized protein LOC141623751 isoform X2 n=1 Tax=Silene latifolia TaxID=37657 RepID=UPI003D781224
MRLIRTEESGWNLHKLLLGFIHSFCLGVEVAERTASLVAGWQEFAAILQAVKLFEEKKKQIMSWKDMESNSWMSITVSSYRD